MNLIESLKKAGVPLTRSTMYGTKKKKTQAGSPVLANWRNIANITNNKETACRKVIYELREIHQRRYITHDHVCEYFMITREQYDRCQDEAAKREASQDEDDG